MTQLLKNGNDVHVMYGHYGQVEWNDALGCNDIALGKANADSEMKILKEYLAPYQGIKGIILTNLLSSVSIHKYIIYTYYHNMVLYYVLV